MDEARPKWPAAMWIAWAITFVLPFVVIHLRHVYGRHSMWALPLLIAPACVFYTVRAYKRFEDNLTICLCWNVSALAFGYVCATLPGFFVTGKSLPLIIALKWFVIGLLTLYGLRRNIRQQERFEEERASYDRWFDKLKEQHKDDPQAYMRAAMDEIHRLNKKASILSWVGISLIIVGAAFLAVRFFLK